MSYFTPTHVAALAKAEGQARRAQDRAMRGIPEARPLRRDSLTHIAETKGLPATSIRAGREIAELAYALTSGVRGRITAAYFERLASGGRGGDFPDRMEIAWRERFRPWTIWAGGPWPEGSRPKLVGKTNTTWLVFTLSICAYNLGLRAASDRAVCHHTTGLQALRLSLAWYAQRAEWVVDHPMRESLDAGAVSRLENVILDDVRPAA